MRILHVVATMKRRGAEVFGADLVRALDGGRDSQQVAVLRSSEGAHVEYQAPTSAVGAEGPQVWGLRLRPSTVRGLRRLIKQWNPELVQVHGGEALKNAVAAVPATKIPIVYRRIGGAPPWIAFGPRRHAHGLLMRRASRVITVAESVRRETIDYFKLPAGRVVTIPNGVDATRMKASTGRNAIRASLGIPDTAPVLLSVAALTWEKDPAAHVAVAARVMQRRPDAVHLFAGDGSMRREIEQEISRNGLDGRIRLLGVRSDVADLLAASDVLLFASRSKGMEGMPASVIEAGMAALPVVGFDVAGVPEVVVDGETGLLAPPGDVQGLAARVLDLFNDEGRMKQMGLEARNRCMELFEMKSIASRYRDLYEGLLAA